LGGKLKHGRFLTFKDECQQHHISVWKFQRVVMGSRVVLVDLPEDGRLLVEQSHVPQKQTVRAAPYRVCKRKLCSGKNANRRIRIFRGSETARSRIEVLGTQFLANSGRA
jgi:hypothetical protein